MIHSDFTGRTTFPPSPQPYRALFVSLLALQTFLASTADAQGFTQVIAHTGEPAPRGNGFFFDFRRPALNDAGQAMFSAYLDGTSGGQNDDFGLYRGSVGSVTQLARKRAAGFATSGIKALGNSVLNDAGQSAFTATIQQALSIGGAELSSVVRGSGGALTTIAQEGFPAPDGNGTFLSLAYGVALNEFGEAAFQGLLTGTVGGANDDTGVFRGSGGPLTQIAREGQNTPDGNGTFADFWATVFNDAGQAAFHADLRGTARGASDDEGIFLGSGGAITQIARERPAGVFTSGLTAFGRPSLNESGAVAYNATYIESLLDGNASRQAVFRNSGTSTTTIALVGNGAPDGNGVLSFLGDPALNDSGQIAFFARLEGTDDGQNDNEGIYLGSGGPLTQVARAGRTTTPDGAYYLYNFRSVIINNEGHVAFQAMLRLPDGTDTSDEGIYMYNGSEILEVARPGQALGNSTILNFGSIATDSTGERDGLNELGQVACLARLYHGEEVIALWTPPALLGDYNNDGTVDAADYVVWRKTDGQTGINLAADGNGNQQVEAGDYNVWSSHFAQSAGPGAGSFAIDNGVPEPATCLSLLLGIFALLSVGRGK